MTKVTLLSETLVRVNESESVINLVSSAGTQVNNILNAFLRREMMCSDSNFFSKIIETFR
ncbi:hypothetical protein D3C80_2040610 [compost metagenome]